jgi:CRP-like cAMP-binding protein
VSLSDEAKLILKMPVERRTDEYVKLAVASLIEAVPEYEDFPNNIQKSIARVAMLQEFEAGRVIIRQNHKADNFYFIVSGISKQAVV